MYADEITLRVDATNFTSIEETRAVIQRELNTLNTHLPLTGMKPSLEKTSHILIG